MEDHPEESFLVKIFQRLRIYKLAPPKERYGFERKTGEADEEEATQCFLNHEKVATVVSTIGDKSSCQVCHEISIPTEALKALPKKGIMAGEMFRQLLIGVVCNLLVIDSGLQEGWSTPTIPKFTSNEDPLRVNADEIAWVVNLLYVGVGLGSTVPFFLMDRIGRKRTLLLAAIPKIISWILIGMASTRTTIFCGRILAGVGCGITYAVMPMYLGEISSKRTRGPLGTMMAVLLNVGMLLIYSIGLWISRFTMAMLAVCVPIIFVATFIWLPESSVFLTRKNRLSSAEKTLRWALAKENVEEELEEIKRIVATEESSRKFTFLEIVKEIYTKRENRRAFGIAWLLLSALTLCGAAPILAYQSEVFERANFHVSTNLIIIVTGCTIVIAGSLCVLLVRLTGKRPLLLISTPVCFFSLATLAVFFTLLSAGYDVSSIKWVPSVFIVTFVLGYGLALNPIPLSYVGEIFSFEMKPVAAIFSSLYYAVTTTTLVKFFQVTQDLYGTHVPLWSFTVIIMIIWVLIYFFVPETEGKTLEEIQLDLKNKE
ncbi:hypothetical protein KPH14_007487 [Odynerus spinipes]|uniref:Major facilitator superfamily (MFS) profile domain-containing protein n=1 Tax=Odynerus spinipes TaxID=1348599 RepID=A0AAD9RB09_9HYME|nr:hypothetical protein KPH14_007487 [Odynerus spinipes]